MSSELERRLEGMLAEAPEPDPGAAEEALHRALRALRALRPVAAPRRGMRTAVLVFAGAVLLLVVAAGSLAAAGALHVSLGTKPKRPPATKQLSLPSGASGIAAIVDGRLSVVTRRGFRLQGLTAGAAALSPHALFIAVGIGRSLVAMAPDGRRAWSHPAGGRVVAIAWAPDGLRIAYIVRDGRRFVLHTIYGNGKRGTDNVIDRSVRSVTPSWRADSLALAYVGAGGHAVVYDLAHLSRDVLGRPTGVTHVAFAPAGKTLALGTLGSAVVSGKTVATGDIEALGWRPDNQLEVALERGVKPALVATFTQNGGPLRGFRVPGRVIGITGGFVVTRRLDRLVAGWLQPNARTVLRVKPAASVRALEIG
jgi:hypothetical protein